MNQIISNNHVVAKIYNCPALSNEAPCRRKNAWCTGDMPIFFKQNILHD